MASRPTSSEERRGAGAPGQRVDGVARLWGLFLLVTLDTAGRVAQVQISEADPGPVQGRHPAAVQAVATLERWIRDPSAPAGLPRAPAPTLFQERLRQALLAMPPGEVVTYGHLARQLGTSARAVGAGCRANPLPLLVPCHRVVAATGPGGYAGNTQGVWVRFKRWLLEQERALRW
ncbi:MAG: methylated-DNA--[protein]-cysteine S-methyltransferase [Halorhodospira sp.]